MSPFPKPGRSAAPSPSGRRLLMARRVGSWVGLWATLSVLGVGVSLGAGALGCRKTAPASAGPDPAASAPSLPPLLVRAAGNGLTFSYITGDGGFQLAKKVDDVPYEARDAVRVWSELSGDGIAGPWVYVADLRAALPDGTFKVEVMAREAFEKLAAERRGKKPPPGPVAVGGGPSAAPGGEKGGPKADVPAPKGLHVILYGAEWCKPCHVAEGYMKQKGIPYVHKDIDDPNVNEEMRDKLAAAGLKSGSIPVFDVAGKILVGFSEGSLDAAWASATKK